MKFRSYKVMAHIHSLDGEMREVTVLAQEELFGHIVPNSYIVEYGGVICTAFLNPIVGQFYADDKYGRLEDYKK